MRGSKILSFGSIGCNFKCGFCQNCDISKEFVLPTIEKDDINELDKNEPAYRINTQLSNYKQMTPQDIINATHHYGLISIAYTYNEPTVFYEMVYETAMLAHENGLSNVLVTNGYINEEPFKLLAPFIDAMNIDVKTYDQHLYRSVCGGDLDSVLNTIRLAIDYNIHIELTCLIVPSLFKDKKLIQQFFRELYDVSGDAYLHLSRYFPRYLYEEKATDIGYMMQIKEMALVYFSHVYLGNV
jgi:pyruvate formate lyase activating enzyme